jgi:hypothetical protein
MHGSSLARGRVWAAPAIHAPRLARDDAPKIGGGMTVY